MSEGGGQKRELSGRDDEDVELPDGKRRPVPVPVPTAAPSFCFKGVNIRLLRNLRDLFTSEDTVRSIKETHLKLWTQNSGLSLAQELEASNTTIPHAELRLRYDEGIGKATVFVSYAWSYTIFKLVQALEKFIAENPHEQSEDQTFFWLDFATASQHPSTNGAADLPPDWWSRVFKESIEEIGHTLLVFLPWQAPEPLKRSWCIWELYCTLSSQTKLSITWGDDQEEEIRLALRNKASTAFSFIDQLDVSIAEASVAHDKVKIDEAVASSPGGFPVVNAQVRAVIKKTVLQVIKRRYFTHEAVPLSVYQHLRSICPHDWLVKDVNEQIVGPIQEEHNCSIIQHLKEAYQVDPHPVIGLTYSQISTGKPPKIFISYSWHGNFAETVEALEKYLAMFPGLKHDEKAFFSDFLSSNFSHTMSTSHLQSASLMGIEPESLHVDYFLVEVDAYRSRVLSMDKILLIINPWDKPLTLTRCWCLFELFTARSKGMLVEFITCREQEARFLHSLEHAFAEVEEAFFRCCSIFSPYAAECWNATESELFREMFIQAQGGLEGFARYIASHYQSWMCKVAELEILRLGREDLLSSSSSSSTTIALLRANKERLVALAFEIR